uniref:Uncharacterized protein n=1 Tax=Micrurus paraensis TaxID=1970185 RepID=A0A2D4KQM7_9SAUR
MPTPYSEVIAAVKRTHVFGFQKEQNKKPGTREKARRGPSSSAFHPEAALRGKHRKARPERRGRDGREEEPLSSHQETSSRHRRAWPRRAGEEVSRGRSSEQQQQVRCNPFLQALREARRIRKGYEPAGRCLRRRESFLFPPARVRK